MSGEKRAASSSFGTTQLVKRQRSEADLNGGALARMDGARGGALIQGVGLPILRCTQAELNHRFKALADHISLG
jgi:Prp8 binding protein